jgi:hypothetical protein
MREAVTQVQQAAESLCSAFNKHCSYYVATMQAFLINTPGDFANEAAF